MDLLFVLFLCISGFYALKTHETNEDCQRLLREARKVRRLVIRPVQMGVNHRLYHRVRRGINATEHIGNTTEDIDEIPRFYYERVDNATNKTIIVGGDGLPFEHPGIEKLFIKMQQRKDKFDNETEDFYEKHLSKIEEECFSSQEIDMEKFEEYWRKKEGMTGKFTNEFVRDENAEKMDAFLKGIKDDTSIDELVGNKKMLEELKKDKRKNNVKKSIDDVKQNKTYEDHLKKLKKEKYIYYKKKLKKEVKEEMQIIDFLRSIPDEETRHKIMAYYFNKLRDDKIKAYLRKGKYDYTIEPENYTIKDWDKIVAYTYKYPVPKPEW